MKRLLAVPCLCLLVMSFATSSASAGGAYYSDVPHYDQNWFDADGNGNPTDDGGGDCLPTAGTMVLAWHDSWHNGRAWWPKIVWNGNNSYAENPLGVRNTFEKVLQGLGGFGSWSQFWDRLFGTFGNGLATGANLLDSGANWWTDDDEFTSWSDMKGQIDSYGPLFLGIYSTENFYWGTLTDGAPGSIDAVGGHAVCMVGYSEGVPKVGEVTAHKWMILDMGWFWESPAWMNYDAAANLYTVEVRPQGTPAQPPSKPVNPNPGNYATGVSRNTTLSWSNGGGATSYNVYFGTINPPGAAQYSGNQSGTTFNPGTLANDSTYFWRVDAMSETGPTQGDLWTFSTEALSGGDVTLTAVADTFVDETSPSANRGSQDYVDILGYMGSRKRALIRFSMNSIPSGSMINSVELRLYSYWCDNPSDVNTWLGVLGQSWGESTATWNSQPSVTSGLSVFKKFSSSSSGVYHSWLSASYPDLKTVVSGWVNGTRSNYGFLLEREQGYNGYTGYRSREWGTSSQRPRLIVNYTPPQTGALTVYINPADVRAQGSQWRLTNGPDTSYHNSGETISDLSTGSYTLYFSSVSGWTRPPAHNTTITIASGSNSRTDTYGFNVSPPSGVAASDGTYSDRIRIEWTASPGATEYEVWRNLVNTTASATRVADHVDGSPYHDYAASVGQTYYYWVKAKNGSGVTGFSSYDSGYLAVVETVATPTFTPDGGSHPGISVNVTVNCSTAGATIRYTTDGSNPTEATPTTVASGGTVSVPIPGTLKAKAWKDGMTPSVTKSATYSEQGDPEPPSVPGWRYPRKDCIGHSCLTQGSTVQTGGALALQTVIPGVKTVLTGDIDGDGAVDVVTCSGTAVSLFDGAGALKQTFALPRESNLSMLEDADGDGVLDIFLGGGGTGFAAYVYKGDGTLLKTFTGQHAGSGDSITMNPIAMSNGKILFGYNAGYAITPRGLAAFDYATTNELWYYQIGPANGIYSVADMDGDGMLDSTMGTFTVGNGASGNGTTDSDLYTIVVDEAGATKLSQIYESPSQGGACHVFADLTGDGLHEIIGFKGHDPTYYNGQPKIHVFGRDGTILNTFDGPNNSGWTGSSWSGAYAVGDLDGDGHPEIVATASPALTTYVLDASLNKLAETNLTGEVRLIGDLTGDGFKEIVLLSDGGLLSVLDRNLNVMSTLQVGTTGGDVIADDINGDGVVELLCRTDKLYVVGLFGGDRNIALAANGAVATAESVGSYMGFDHPGSHANDGDTETFWANSWSMPTYLEIAFNRTYLIDKVAVVWGVGAHNQTFSISLSENGSDWTVVVPSRASDTDAGDEGAGYHGNTTIVREQFPITPRIAHFMRIDVTATSAPGSHIFKAVLHELEAFGVPVQIPLEVTTLSLPNAMESMEYVAQLEAAGGLAPYTWSVAEGYAESEQANSFSVVGTGQEWHDDDASWSLALPFEFPFFGVNKTTVHVGSNGTLTFDDGFADYSPNVDTFKARQMIAPMWNDYVTDPPYDIYVAQDADSVSIRWHTHYWGDASDVNFTAVLHRNGSVVLKYGSGNPYGGLVGISAGDGENYTLSASGSGSMENANDIAFAPVGRLPDGLTCPSDGALCGQPTTTGTNRVTFIVHDTLGETASRELEIEVVPLQTASGIPFSWLLIHDLPTDGSVDHQRLFGSTFTVLQHWLAGTDPNNRDTDLRMTDAPIKHPQGFAIRWRSVAARTYRIERSSDLTANPAFSALEGATGIQGVDGVSEFIDETATGPGPFFYRVAVE